MRKAFPRHDVMSWNTFDEIDLVHEPDPQILAIGTTLGE